MTPLGGYCASKFTLIGLTEALRMELRGKPVHVGLVLPGVVETSMVEQVSRDGEALDFWLSSLNMPPSWVVWAVFAVCVAQVVGVEAKIADEIDSLAEQCAATLRKIAADANAPSQYGEGNYVQKLVATNDKPGMGGDAGESASPAGGKRGTDSPVPNTSGSGAGKGANSPANAATGSDSDAESRVEEIRRSECRAAKRAGAKKLRKPAL